MLFDVGISVAKPRTKYKCLLPQPEQLTELHVSVSECIPYIWAVVAFQKLAPTRREPLSQLVRLRLTSDTASLTGACL